MSVGRLAWLRAPGSGLRAVAHSPQPPALSAAKGFSLVELVISLAILSVGLVGAMRVFPVGLRASQRSEMNSRATFVAQRTLESLKLVPWEELAEGDTTAEEDGFQMTTRISQPTLDGVVDPSRLKMIEVIVGWTQDGRPRALSFLTYIRRSSSG